MSGQTLRQVAPAGSAEQPAHKRRLRLGLWLMVAVWALGAVGHFTPLREWPALFLYVLGTLGVVWAYCRPEGRWAELGITRRNLSRSLGIGVGLGVGLMLLDWVNTFMYYRGGGAPMAEMEALLVGMRLLYLFPVLVLAEEFLWRGTLLLAWRDGGMNLHVSVFLSTFLYAVNHFFVAPVGWVERGLMAGMALPIGIVGGYLTAKTRNVWGAVAIHMLTFVSMVADIYVIPALAR